MRVTSAFVGINSNKLQREQSLVMKSPGIQGNIVAQFSISLREKQELLWHRGRKWTDVTLVSGIFIFVFNIIS